MEQILVTKDGRQLGPYTRDETRWLISQGFLTDSDLAWTIGKSDWIPLHSIIGGVPATTSRPSPIPAMPVPPTVPVQTVVGHSFQLAKRGIRINDFIISLIAFVALYNYAPKSVLAPVAALTGMLLCYLGCDGIPPLRRGLYSAFPQKETRSAEITSVVVAVLLAILSLVVWMPLFTFSHWLLWSEMSLGLVILWFVNTAIFGYSFFLTRKMSRGSLTISTSAPDR